MADPEPIELQFSYEKSNFFRVVHADGAYGGVTPLGSIHMAFYNERHPIPKTTVLPIKDGKAAGQEIVKSKRDGMFREVEVDVVMDLNTAVALRIWLDDKLKIAKTQLGISDDEWNALQSGINV